MYGEIGAVSEISGSPPKRTKTDIEIDIGCVALNIRYSVGCCISQHTLYITRLLIILRCH